MGYMKYKGYTGSVEYSEEDNCLYGKVMGMSRDAITYEGQDVNELRKDFEGAIDDYLAKVQDWDYAYLIALEKKKLQRMHDYIKSESRLEHKDFATRDISICIRLIDIFMEDDAVHNTWLEQSFSGKLKFTKLTDDLYELDNESRPISDYPIYVNVRNEKRFFRRTPIKDAQSVGDRKRAILSIASLRQEKALHLYHLIREYKLFEWWC